MTAPALSATICPTCQEAPRTFRGALRVATLAEALAENERMRHRIEILERALHPVAFESRRYAIALAGERENATCAVTLKVQDLRRARDVLAGVTPPIGTATGSK